MTRRTTVLTALAILTAGAVLGSAAAACGDGRPAFCDDLARDGDLGGLTKALSAGELAGAQDEAARLTDLADAAPADIRDQFGALAEAVADIVDLLEVEAAGGPPGTVPPDADAPAGGDQTTTTATTVAGGAGGDPAEVERRREELNERLGELSGTSSDVENWARRNCGIELS